jgi:hypothetical protein
MKKSIKPVCLILVILTAVTGLYAENLISAWGVGEKLTFSIRWGIITCGYAHMEVREKVSISEREAFRIITTARSAAFFDPFFKVRDRIESYIDVELLRTLRYEKIQREGNYKKDITIVYDHNYGVAYENGHKFEITEGVQDVLSALYYLRTKDLAVGKIFQFDVGTGKKNWPLEVEVIKKERIKVPAGKFDTFVVIPRLREEGIFKAKGELWVWLTDDERKFPVKMQSKIEIGSISAVLIKKKLSKKQ